MIHQFKLNGYNIIMDVNSGAVHTADPLFYDLVESLDAVCAGKLSQTCPDEVKRRLTRLYPSEEIDECYGEALELYNGGQLFSIDDYERFSSLMKPSPVKAMCLHIAHDCNLRCKYCFADTGEYMGCRELMSPETGRKAIDYLLHYSQGRHNLEIDFFGGEPLMNFDTVKDIVAYARSKQRQYDKNFRFTITTNGLLLDDAKMEFINNEMSNVVLSLDGRKDVNDRMRARADGRGSYDSIVPKYQRMVESRRKSKNDQYYVRGTFTRFNLDFTQDVLHLYELGFDQVSVEPVVASESDEYALRHQDLPRIYDEYETLASAMLERQSTSGDFNFFHFMMDLEQGPCAIKRLRGCGCGNEYVAIAPSGDVYPCHQFVGHGEWKMGSVYDMSLDEKLKRQFAEATVYGKDDCKKCWAKFYCSGGCNANGMLYNGDILKPHKMSCALEKKRVECAIMLKIAESEKQGAANAH